MAKEKIDIWSLEQKIKTLLFYLLLFLFPTQSAIHFWPDFSFVFGIRIDYLSIAIYLTDILFFLLFLIDFKKIIKSVLKKRFLFIFLFLVILNIVFSSIPVLSFLKWFHILFLLFFSIFISINKKLFKEKIIEKIIYLSAVLFSVIGICQFLLKRTLGGFFYYLGERTFNINTPGISTFNFFGKEFLRAYSTFSHPNSFAGFLGVVLIYLILSKNVKKLPLITFGLLIIFLAILTTFSFSAAISLFFIGILYLLEKKFGLKKIFYYFLLFFIFIISLSQTFISSEFVINNFSNLDKITQRLDLAHISGIMFSERFLTGWGLNTFIPNIPKFKSWSGYIWFLQPVHNINLLILSEVGIFGFIFFYFILLKTILKALKEKKTNILYSLIFILITGLFDHYWITLQQNLVLIFFIFSYVI